MASVVVFGKIPPLQGGVAVQTLEFVRALRARGHRCTIITTNLDADADFNEEFTAADWVEFDRRLAGAAVIRIDSTSPIAHIPRSSALETRLLGAGAEVVATADLVIGWYFQPFGVAAAMAASNARKPCVIVHAGSDLSRLCANPDLLAAYRLLFRGAYLLSVSPRSRPLLEERFPLTDGYRIVDALPGAALPSYFNTRPKRRPQGVSSPFRLGVYGKCGQQKGHFDLLAALSILGHEGVELEVAFCTGGRIGVISALRDEIRRRELRKVNIGPLIAPWQVPAFIDSCDAVAFLERDFEVNIHGPQIPKEVMWRRRALVCSAEIVAKQWFSRAMVPWVNYVPAGDPKQHVALAASLARLVREGQAREIGASAGGLIRQFLGRAPTTDTLLSTLEHSGLL
ncbi:glycosyltransferase [Sorangium sp. So ce321]|uniref:glycosyltransferase n=1 Tax=Sorangium sp. So ce321 TaxID=3133300 RepID=UPI003F648084